MTTPSEIRIASNLLPASALDEPFTYIGTEYNVEDFVRGIPQENDELDAGTFPHNIEQYFWIHQGERDEEAWYAVGKLTNGFYFFYAASCDYTGFDCQGSMTLILSKDYNNLVQYGMTAYANSLYLAACK